jgi:malonate transporter MadM subunit
MTAIEKVLTDSSFIFSFLLVGIIMWVSFWLSATLTRGRIPGVAIAISIGLGLAFFGHTKGLADVPLFAGLAFLGGSVMRDFSIVSTAMGASFTEIKKAGTQGILSLFIGVLLTFFLGGIIGYILGYRDAKSFTTIGAGACTFIVGPVTGSAVGATSDVIALSIAIGVIKSVVVTIATPLVAKRIGLDNPQTAMIYGGLIGTTSGVAAGLAATDTKLVPYGSLTATFYTGLGCLLCPSILYFIVLALLG